jgi:tetratricopeptide (TPR) repeat protein
MKTQHTKTSRHAWASARLLVTVAVGAALFFALSPAARAAEEDALSLLNTGSALIEAGKYNDAVDVLTRAAKAEFPENYRVDSNYALIYTSRGLAYYYLGFVDDALADYDTALGLDPKNPDALNNRGVIKEKKGDITGALADYSAAIASDALLAKAYFNRASLYISMKKGPEALKDLNQYIDLVADNPDVYNRRGRIFLDSGQYKLAAADFYRALYLKPDDRDASVNLGRVYLATKDYSKAEETFSRVLMKNPDDAETYALRARAREGLGNTSGAEADKNKAREINPNP